MTRPTAEDVALDLDEATWTRIYALLARLLSDGSDVTSAELLRGLVEVGLDEAEKDPQAFAAQQRTTQPPSAPSGEEKGNGAP